MALIVVGLFLSGRKRSRRVCGESDAHDGMLVLREKEESEGTREVASEI